MIGLTVDGRYRILERLGEGGMGTVYLAQHLQLDRKDALKVLHARLAHDPSFAGRFRREARASNRLDHPNIVRVYDFGRLPDGRVFLAMEHADGESLEGLLDRERLVEVPRALKILAQLADAVDHAHSRGVVHRDLKPANLVLITQRGRADVVKVLDFGLAKIVAPDYDESRRLSTRGDVLGTALYLSPEQIQGVGTDPRSDLYAIGCIGYELCTGTPPFEGSSMELLRAHVVRTPEPPSARLPPEMISRELDAVLLGCLAKNPDERFQSGHALKVALEQVPGYRDPRASGVRSASQAARPTLARDADTEKTASRDQRYALLSARAQGVLGNPEVARLSALADELAAALGETEAASAELEARCDALEAQLRAREAELGFALGELYDERSRASDRAAHDRAIAAHEAELAEVDATLTRGLAQLSDENRVHVAARAQRSRRSSECCRAADERARRSATSSRTTRA